MVLDSLRVFAPAGTERFLGTRVILEVCFVIVEDMTGRDVSTKFGLILSKKSFTSVGLTLARLRLMFLGFFTFTRWLHLDLKDLTQSFPGR